ncbi:MAG TPA: hypothetical protein VFE53_08180 [Mucilaginibacter sp.]|jgi:hypothetical protein|nr:hypothetical protein [Mucilaginibacter sp.]
MAENVLIHFLTGNDQSAENHYAQKAYRNDVVVEIDGLFYEVYFYVESTMKYEMRLTMKDEITASGFFSMPGLIVVEDISNEIIYSAIDQLVDLKYFDWLVGKRQMPINNRFQNLWSIMSGIDSSKKSTYKLR